MNAGTDDHADVRVLPPVIFVSAFALGAIVQSLISSVAPATPLIRMIGWSIFGVSSAWALAAALRIWSAGTTATVWRPSTALVQDGPYAYSRNPLYLGATAQYVGLALAFGTWLALVMLPIALWLVQKLNIEPEERYLLNKFGQTYQNYSARVRRWL